MKKPTRYAADHNGHMVPTKAGPYVWASDADALLAERDAEIARLRIERHEMTWKLIEWAECKHCGGDAECLHATGAYDGDTVRCMDCGCPGIVSSDVDEAHVNWHDPSPGECDCWWCRAYDAESQLTAHREAVRVKDEALRIIDAMPVDGCSPFAIESMLRQAKSLAYTALRSAGEEG